MNHQAEYLEEELRKARAEIEELRKRVCVPDVSTMARVLSDRVASARCVDPEDNWKIYGQEFIEDVRAMLAAPAPVERATDKESLSVDQLWAVHAQGPDELYPAFNRDDAEKHAAALNALSANCDIKVSAVVVESPWPPVDHWKYLAEQEREHAEQFVDVDAIFPKAAPVERVEQDAKVFWVLFDNTGDVKYIKKDVYSGTLAFFDNEADASLAKQITPDTDYMRVEYYATPQPAPTAAQDVAGLVEALELALEYWRDRQQRYKNRKPRWVADAESALAAHQQREGE